MIQGCEYDQWNTRPIEDKLQALLKVAKMCLYDVKEGMMDKQLVSHVWTEIDEELDNG
jgi:hypothetical protein